MLARSQGGHRAPVVDLATDQTEIGPQGAFADLDNPDGDSPFLSAGASLGAEEDAPPGAVLEDSNKSASRLAAERRRQKILSRSTERMAKVQGDRVIREGGNEATPEQSSAGGGGGGESLDDVSLAALQCML